MASWEQPPVMCDGACAQHPLGEAESAAPAIKLILVVPAVGVEAVPDCAGQKAGQRPASAGCLRLRLHASTCGLEAEKIEWAADE
jgi:hypothetical protein